MKRRVPWFEVALLAGALVLGLSVYKSLAPTTPDSIDPARVSPNYRFPGGVLAPVPVEWKGDSYLTAEMMNLQVWKFAMKRTGVAQQSKFQLEVREAKTPGQKRKPPKVLWGQEMQPGFDSKTRRADLVVAMMPLQDDLNIAQKIKLRIGTGGVTYTIVVENPFRNYSSGASTPASEPDIPLLGVRQYIDSDRIKTRDLTLFLKITAKP